jgi:hypothetical protein
MKGYWLTAVTEKLTRRLWRIFIYTFGPAKNVLNVGAGSGSYEANDHFIVSIELPRCFSVSNLWMA